MPSFRGIRQTLRGGKSAGRGDSPYPNLTSGNELPSYLKGTAPEDPGYQHRITGGADGVSSPPNHPNLRYLNASGTLRTTIPEKNT